MIKKKKLNEDEIIRKRVAQKEQVAVIWTRVSSAEQYKNNCSIDTQRREKLVKTFANETISKSKESLEQGMKVPKLKANSS